MHLYKNSSIFIDYHFPYILPVNSASLPRPLITYEYFIERSSSRYSRTCLKIVVYISLVYIVELYMMSRYAWLLNESLFTAALTSDVSVTSSHLSS